VDKEVRDGLIDQDNEEYKQTHKPLCSLSRVAQQLLRCTGGAAATPSLLGRQMTAENQE